MSCVFSCDAMESPSHLLLKEKTLSSTLRDEVRQKISRSCQPVCRHLPFSCVRRSLAHPVIGTLICLTSSSCGFYLLQGKSVFSPCDQRPSPPFLRTHVSHQHTYTSPHISLSPSRLSWGFLEAPGLLRVTCEVQLWGRLPPGCTCGQHPGV